MSRVHLSDMSPEEEVLALLWADDSENLEKRLEKIARLATRALTAAIMAAYKGEPLPPSLAISEIVLAEVRRICGEAEEAN